MLLTVGMAGVLLRPLLRMLGAVGKLSWALAVVAVAAVLMGLTSVDAVTRVAWTALLSRCVLSLKEAPLAFKAPCNTHFMKLRPLRIRVHRRAPDSPKRR